MRMRTTNRAARARIIGAVFVIIAHQIRAFCLPVIRDFCPVSFCLLRDFLPIGFHPLPRYIPPRLLQSSVRGGVPRRATVYPTGLGWRASSGFMGCWQCWQCQQLRQCWQKINILKCRAILCVHRRSLLRGVFCVSAGSGRAGLTRTWRNSRCRRTRGYGWR